MDRSQRLDAMKWIGKCIVYKDDILDNPELQRLRGIHPHYHGQNRSAEYEAEGRKIRKEGLSMVGSV